MNAVLFRRSVVGAMLLLAVGCKGCAEPQQGVAVGPHGNRIEPVVVLPPAPPVAAIVGGTCPAPTAPKNPVEYGVCILTQSLAKAQSAAKVAVLLASDPAAQGIPVEAAPESFSIVSRGDQTFVVGQDATGAMYGALEVAERLDQNGPSALPVATPVKTSPVLKTRGANLFIVLPEAGRPWWFREPEFWVEYLDMMARARLNFLDMHGMYNLDNTIFPNALLYFATSVSVPDAGIPKSEREANLQMLNEVIAMANVRGIEVGLMSYRADLSLSGNDKESEVEKATVPIYTREAVADLATRAPGLRYLGFRIGESKRSPDWYTATYVDALKSAHAHATAYTRTWKTVKQDLVGIVTASGPDTIVESKYNGEQLGLPYIISGGGMQRWKSYSFEDFLDPPTPYQFVFQVRAGGTHRIFRYASYSRTKRTINSMLISKRVAGFTLEAAHAYFPQRDFYHANPADSFSQFAFRRDELSYLLFGRLGYDPNTPESVFRGMLKQRVGTDGLWDAVQAASDITPWMLAGHTCGPDQRDYAPELELGGPVAFWATPSNTRGPKGSCAKDHETFDEFALALPNETADDLLQQRGTSRVSPVDLSLTILADAKEARTATKVAIDPTNREARDVVRECVALADLGEWFAHKYRGATALAVYEGSLSGRWLEAAKTETREADAAYTQLAKDTAYIATFEERMRMRHADLLDFHWAKQVPRLAGDAISIEEVEQEMRSSHVTSRAKGQLPDPKAWLNAARKPGPGLAKLDVNPDNPRATSWVVTATFATPPPRGAIVKILSRRFQSDGPDWEGTLATGSGTTWTATVQGRGQGEMFAVEVNGGPGQAWRYPDVMTETPYKALAP